jgi:hypothetical protein
VIGHVGFFVGGSIAIIVDPVADFDGACGEFTGQFADFRTVPATGTAPKHRARAAQLGNVVHFAIAVIVDTVAKLRTGTNPTATNQLRAGANISP